MRPDRTMTPTLTVTIAMIATLASLWAMLIFGVHMVGRV